MSNLTFNIAWHDLGLAGAALLLFGGLAAGNLRRSATPRRHAVLEALRLAAIVAIVLTLFEPEWILRQERRGKPEVVILGDSSASMGTRDQADGNGGLTTRAAWLKQNVDAKFHARLQSRFAVTVEHFAGTGGNAGGTNLAAALERTLAQHRDLRAVLLVSDGDWNEGADPIGAALQLRAAQVPVIAAGTGSTTYLPDLVLEKGEMPAFCMLNEKILVPFAVQSHLQRAVRTRVQLQTQRGQPQERTADIPAGGRADGFFLWQPASAGEDILELRVPPEKEEILADNNVLSFPVQVRHEQLRVLIVESLPRWEYRYLRNALVRDPGVEVQTVLSNQADMSPGDGPGYLKAVPTSRDELAKFDVVFLGDVGIGDRELNAEQAALLRGLVQEQGSGLVFLPGSRGRQLSLAGTPLAELLPVVYDPAKPTGLTTAAEGRMELTSIGRDHLLTMLADTPAASQRLWKQLPGFYWCAAVQRAVPGAKVLAVHESLNGEAGRVPLLAVKSAGNGQVLFLGTDSAWRWRRGVEDKYHYRFWGQVVRWMAHKRHLAYREGVRLFYSPEHPGAGDTVTLQATVMNPDGFPLSGAKVACAVRPPGPGPGAHVALEPVPGSWGVYRGEFTPKSGGSHRVSVTCPEAGIAFETQLAVLASAVEKTGVPARFGPLQDIVSVTGGTFLTADRLDAAVLTVARLPERALTERRIQIWCQWWWGGLVTVLLAAYWSLRKWWGLI